MVGEAKKSDTEKRKEKTLQSTALSLATFNLDTFCNTDIFGDLNRKKGHTRERNSMLSATSLVIRLGDLYHQNLIVTMPMYVSTGDWFSFLILLVIPVFIYCNNHDTYPCRFLGIYAITF